MMLKILFAISTQLELVVAKREKGKLTTILFLVIFVHIVGPLIRTVHVLFMTDKREKKGFLIQPEVSLQ